MAYIWCKQCDKLHHAKRSTALFCSTKCRVANHRNQPQIKKSAIVEQMHQVLLAVSHNGKAYDYIEELKAKYGSDAMNHALLAIGEMLR